MQSLKIESPDEIGLKIDGEALARSKKVGVAIYTAFIAHLVALGLLLLFGEREPLSGHLEGVYIIEYLLELLASGMVFVGLVYYLEEHLAVSGYKLDEMPKSQCQNVLRILDDNPELHFLRDRIKTMDRKLVVLESEFLVNYEQFKVAQERELACKRLYGIES